MERRRFFINNYRLQDATYRLEVVGDLTCFNVLAFICEKEETTIAEIAESLNLTRNYINIKISMLAKIDFIIKKRQGNKIFISVVYFSP